MPSFAASRRQYLASAATAAALAVLQFAAAPSAQAADECGALSSATGTVACSPGSYGNGISYSSLPAPPAATSNVDVQLQGGTVGGSGVTVTTSNGGTGQVDFTGNPAISTNAGGANGVSIRSSGDAVVSGGTGATVTTSGGSANGFSLSSLAAAVRNVTFNFLGTTVTQGAGSAGVAAADVDNFISSGLGAITTSGANSAGVSVTVRSGGPDKAVTIASPDHIQTSGASSDGISIQAPSGTTTVVDISSSGQIETSGATSRGIGISIGGGSIGLDAANVSTTGASSNAIDLTVLDSGNIDVRSLGTITTTTPDSKGVAAQAAQGNVAVNATSAVIKSGGSGVEITAANGDASINANSVTVITKGDNAAGLSATAGTGSAFIGGSGTLTGQDVNITTSGANSAGVIAKAGASAIVDISGSVTTLGAGSVGVEALITTSGTAVANFGKGTISTSGANANALHAESVSGDASATATNSNIATKGANSVGVLAKTLTGNATVVTGSTTISTSGDGAHAVEALVTGSGIASVSTNGDTLTTSGKGANGVYAVNTGAGPAVVNFTGSTVTTSGDQSHAVQVTTGNGAATADILNGTLSTSGVGSNGVNLLAAGGDASLALGGSVMTSGAGSAAAFVFSAGGNAVVTTKAGDGPNVKTIGDGSNGYDVSSVTGNASVDLVNGSSVETDGSGARGVLVRAFNTAVATIGGLVSSFGANSTSVDVRSSGAGGTDDATANVSAVVRANGATSTAVKVSTHAGTATANIQADVFATGTDGIGVDVVSTSGAGVTTLAGNVSAAGTGVHLGAAGGNNLTNGAGMVLAGGTVAAIHVDAGSASIVNNGSMQATSGRLVLGDGSAKAITISNNGLMSGFMSFATNDSVINNAATGVWTATGTSTFGSGTSVVNNDGILRTDPASAGSAAVTLSQLGTLNNRSSGLITMANGKVGDSITTTGNYSGQTGSRLGVDAFLGGPGSKADTFAIGGSASGQTAISVNDLNSGPGRYNPDGIVVVTVGGTNSPSSFTLAGGPVDKGLWQYDLSRIGKGTFALITAPSGEVMSASSLVPQARRYWQAGQDGFDDHRAAIRAAVTGAPAVAPAAPQNSITLGYAAPDTNPFDTVFGMTGKSSLSNPSSGAFWGQVIHQQFTDKKNSAYSNGSVAHAYDSTTDQSLTRFIGGVDLGADLRANSAVSFGIYGGYGTADGKMNTAVTGGLKTGLSSLSLHGSSIGGYAQYLNGPWWVGLSGLYDMLDADYRIDRVGFTDKIKGNVWGVQADAGWTVRWTYGTVEPFAALTWLSTNYGTVDSPWGQFAFGTQAGLDGKVGVRSHTPFWNADGWVASVLAEGAYAHTLTGKNVATFDGFALPNMAADSWGNVGGGLEVATRDGRISGYAKADWLASSGVSGYNLVGGMTYRW